MINIPQIRIHLLFTIKVIVILLLLSCREGPEMMTKPNVVLIVSDDQGWGDLSINGNSNLKTPNIDRLAK
ncbi:MAG: sulfatase-like hydrolase/transferase [Saprospiraceae bacterium]|nr:sulfatase-like hydrolase/transferase [Saprospiraceae bacterium]